MDDSCRSDENEVYNNIDTTGNRTVCREENMARAQEDSVAPKKKKRVSKKTELENKLSSLETRFDDKFNKLFELFQDRSSTLGTRDTVISQPGGLATQQKNVSIGERRPILSLDPNLDEMLGSPKISRNIDIDTRSEISLQPDSRERTDLLGLCSSDDESQSSINTAHMTQSNSKTKNIYRFSRYLNVQSTASATQPDMGQCSSSKSTDNSIKSTCTNLNVLSKIFTEDIPIDSDQGVKSSENRRLGHISRSKRCLSTCSNISYTSEISPILHSKPVLSIQSPLFRTNFSTKSLHKNSVCSGSIPENSRHKTSCISRRLADCKSEQKAVIIRSRELSQSPEIFRFSGKQRKIDTYPNPNSNLLGGIISSRQGLNLSHSRE